MPSGILREGRARFVNAGMGCRQAARPFKRDDTSHQWDEKCLSCAASHRGPTVLPTIGAEGNRSFNVVPYFDRVKNLKKVNVISGLWEHMICEKTS